MATKVSAADAQFLRNLDTNQDGKVTGKEAQEAVDGALDGKHNAKLSKEEKDVFSAVNAEMGASKKIIRQVVSLAEGSGGALAVPKAERRKALVLALPFDLASAKLTTATGDGTFHGLVMKDATGRELSVQIADIHKANALSAIEIFAHNPARNPSDSEGESVSRFLATPVLAQRLADAIQKAVHASDWVASRFEPVDSVETAKDTVRVPAAVAKKLRELSQK